MAERSFTTNVPQAHRSKSTSKETGSPVLESAEPLLAQTSIKVVRNRSRHGYAHLLGLPDASASSLHEQVRTGLSFSTLDHLQNRLDHSLIDLAEVIHLPARTLQRRKVEGRLQPDESDRLLRFARILWKTTELFDGDLQVAVQWLTNPVTGLGGMRPLDLSQTEPGSQEVEALIGRLEHGVFA